MAIARNPDRQGPQRGRQRSAGSPGEQLDEDCKRLLVAILELSLLLRYQDSPAQESRLAVGRISQEHGLGPRHRSALLSVALYGPLTITQLANRHHVTVKTASLIAVELEKAGLLERKEDPSDRRRTIVAVAKDKERAVNEGLNNRAARLQRTLARLTPSQREGLITGLGVLTEEMSEVPRK